MVPFNLTCDLKSISYCGHVTSWMQNYKDSVLQDIAFILGTQLYFVILKFDCGYGTNTNHLFVLVIFKKSPSHCFYISVKWVLFLKGECYKMGNTAEILK